ncbi:MAG: DUF6973 domain-containing protein [Rhodospirillales bacterium]
MDNYYNRAKSAFNRFSGAQAASTEAVSSQLPGRENGPADAYRHVLFAAELTRRFGESVARKLLQSKETGDSLFGISSSDTAKAVEMDEHNNEVGIHVGKSAESWNQVIEASQKVISDSPKDGRGGSGKAVWLNKKKWLKDPKNDVDPDSPAPLNWPNIDWEHGQKYGGSYDYPEGNAKYTYGQSPQTEEQTAGPEPTTPHVRQDSGSETPESTRLGVEATWNAAEGRPAGVEASDVVPESARARAMAIVAGGQGGKGAAEAENYLDDMMLKTVDDLTEAEAKTLGQWAWKMPSNDPRRLAVEDHRRNFYRLNYGDGFAELDETGRLIEPEPVREIPLKTKGLTTPNGEPVSDALKRIADKLARANDADGEMDVVKALQSGLSMLGEPLKVDGVSGPETKTALKRTVARNGSGRAEEAFAVIEHAARGNKSERILDAFDAVLAAGRLSAHRRVWDSPLLREMREWQPGGTGPDDGLDAVAGCLLAEPVRLAEPGRVRDARARGMTAWRGMSSPVRVSADFDI